MATNIANNIPIDLSGIKPDFEAISSALQTNLKTRDSWKDLYVDATGQTLIHFNSAIGTMDQWAIEKALKEAFLGTADVDSSIYAGTRMLGVRISRKIPGTQICKVQRINKVNLPIDGTLVIPEYSQFYIGGNTPFFNRSVLNFVNYTDTLNNVQLNQGQVVVKNYVSDGQAFQQLIIPALSPMSISEYDVVVHVNNVAWTTIQDGLWHYKFGDTVVSDSTLGNGDLILQFGNGVNGAIPPLGANVTITYVETLGAKQTLIANASEVVSAAQINGFVLKGSVTKEQGINLITGGFNQLDITLSSITEPLAKAYLMNGYPWDVNFMGLQLECSGGSAMITGVNANVLSLSVVTPFASTVLTAGSWSITVPATGLDEKPAIYYKVLAPDMNKANNRAVTPPDHKAIFLSYPGISDVLVRTEKDLKKITRVAKTFDAIAKERELGVYNNIDYYEIVTDPHPAFFNMVWASLLTQNGIPLTDLEMTELLNWFSKKQFTGSRIRLQQPSKFLVNLYIELKCLTGIDPVIVRSRAEFLITDMFSTAKPMLSKKVTVSDIYKVLNKGLENQLDSCSVTKLISANTDGTYTTAPLTNTDLTPGDASLDAFGFPLPPEYLSLNNLVIISALTDR
jgi:hypothetical protein